MESYGTLPLALRKGQAHHSRLDLLLTPPAAGVAMIGVVVLGNVRLSFAGRIRRVRVLVMRASVLRAGILRGLVAASRTALGPVGGRIMAAAGPFSSDYTVPSASS